MACAERVDVHRRVLAARGQFVRCALERGRTSPKDIGGGTGGPVMRRCCTRWRDSGEGLGDARALRLAMLGEREVVEAVLSDCVDIVLHGEQG